MGVLDPLRIVLDNSEFTKENSDNSSIDLQTKNLATFPQRQLPKTISSKIFEKIDFFDFPFSLLPIQIETEAYEIRSGVNRYTNQKYLLQIYKLKNQKKFAKKHIFFSKELSLYEGLIDSGLLLRLQKVYETES